MWATIRLKLLHITYDSEPNAKIGDDIELIVSNGNHFIRHVGTIVKISPPMAKSGARGEKMAEAGRRYAEAVMNQMTGIDPRLIPKDPYREGLLRSQWTILISRKSSDPVKSIGKV